MDVAIDLDGVSRAFGDGRTKVLALRDVCFAVRPGEILALLGSNGAGKTTLIKILSTLLLPTAGTARILGLDVVQDYRRVRACQSAILGGDRGLYGRLTARDNLRFFGMLNGVPRRQLRTRVDDELEKVGLHRVADRKVETLSKGMRQRLHIAIGLISRPRVLLLDEPTVGLDPAEAERLRESIADLRAREVTVLLTSHYLLDVEKLADRVVLLTSGRVTHDMPLARFIETAGFVATVTIRGRGPTAALATQGGLLFTGSRPVDVQTEGDRWTIRLRVKQWQPESFDRLSQLMAGAEVHDVQVAPARLEDAFARLTAAGR